LSFCRREEEVSARSLTLTFPSFVSTSVSGLEMSQNSARIQWTREEVDEKLKTIMENCYNNCFETGSKYTKETASALPSLVAGANIAGFVLVADAMKAQGDWW